MRILIFISAALFLQSCLRLDSNLNNNSKLTSYRWDDYPGYVDFTLTTNYKIPLMHMHEFDLYSKDTVDNKTYTIKALYVGDFTKLTTDTVILYCHGNRDHMDFYWPRAKLLANVGGKNRFAVMMLDYRGYGMSQGDPTEEGLYQDVNAALEWLKSKGFTNDRVVMYGFSLGSAPAVKLMVEPRSTLVPSKLILENPFASAELMVQDAAQLAMPASYYTNLKLNNAEEIKKLQQPFMLLESEKDKFLKPESHGFVVYNNYKGTYSEKHVVPNADHSTLQVEWGMGAYSDAVEAFILKK
ncbi:MAG: alpha/beta fold hydrolase [Bacteroidetes bacterium]|nr:alpha/beta fold hydrolase [Bacteroidota bacterium]